MLLGEKPGSVCQNLVEFSELLQLLRGFVQTIEPLGITPHLEEVIDVQVDQIGALMSRCRLKNTSK